MSDYSEQTQKQVIAILQHDRVKVSWLCRAVVVDGKARTIRMARLAVVLPGPRGSTVQVAVSDWGPNGDQPVRQYVGRAGGHGYDKLAAATTGATAGGLTIGNHSDTWGSPTWDRVGCAAGWEWIGGIR